MPEFSRIELIASDEPIILAKLPLDMTAMKSGQGDRCLAGSASTNENNRGQVFGETNDPLDQFIASETGPGRWWRWFIR